VVDIAAKETHMKARWTWVVSLAVAVSFFSLSGACGSQTTPEPDPGAPSNNPSGVDAGTDAGTEDSPDSGGRPPVSFSAQVQPLFSSRCIGCHQPNPDGGLPSGNLILTEGNAHGNLVNVAMKGRGCAVDAGSEVRVKPGAPDESMLYRKITSAPTRCGGVMPPAITGLTTSAAEQETVRAWISEGALNN
jgi:hypothetical protein